MEDSGIIRLYWERSEQAVRETELKYGSYCRRIAYNILNNAEDTEESVSDTWLGAWNSMPPHRPTVLSVFLGKITRRISIDRWRARNAERRGGGELTLALTELEDCVSGSENVEREVERGELERAINAFLDGLASQERNVFLCRYWYLQSVREISNRFGFSESKVTSMLYRTRGKLRKYLVKERLL